MPAPKQQRPHCQACQRPLRSCICDLCCPIENRVSIELLQHPNESKHPKGSAKLLQLSLHGIRSRQGEHFPELAAELEASEYHDLLLYPEDNMARSMGSSLNHQNALSTENKLRLWVIDGTWRKSYKMLQLNPCLNSLARYSPRARDNALYDIRKAPKEGQLSTLEACCYALSDLEGDTDKYEPLLLAFQTFNTRWMAYRTKPS